MNEFVKSRIEELRADYSLVQGKPFTHFYCPILFRDEDAPLCRAHIINQAFSDSARACTVQRKDVDSFYGSRFESDFIDIQNFKDKSMLEIISDRALSKRFSSKILLEDEPVEFFFSEGNVPEKFTEVKLEGKDVSVPFGLKMHPTDFMAAEGKHWEIEISRDVRIPMMVSVIKAAHLTLFNMLGYSYALSLAGHFVGRQILGEFFLQNRDKPKAEVLKHARPFFREFVHMVRPLISCGFDSQGTVIDKTFYMCMGSSGSAWAMLVFVKTSHVIHAALMPVFEQAEQAATYLEFLKNGNESIQVAVCRFKQDRWEISNNTMPLNWPKSGTLYP
jgi:hypothetical protein